MITIVLPKKTKINRSSNRLCNCYRGLKTITHLSSSSIRNDREHLWAPWIPVNTREREAEVARLSPDRWPIRRLGRRSRGRRGRGRGCPLGAALLLSHGWRGRFPAGSGALAASGGGGRGLVHTRVIRGGSVGRVLFALLQGCVMPLK